MRLEKIEKTWEKSFFSPKLSLSLRFYPNGGVKGLLHPFPIAPSLTTEVTGFYTDLEIPHLVGFVETGSNDFLYNTQSCFTGKIIKYNVSSECLILKWLVFCHPVSSLKSTCCDDVFVLFDSPKKNYDEEIQKHKIVNSSLKMLN